LNHENAFLSLTTQIKYNFSRFMGDFRYFFNQLGLDYQYNALGKGLLDSRNIIYFLTIIFVALWVTKFKISALK
jgi:ABC-2 type transport system permease protein